MFFSAIWIMGIYVSYAGNCVSNTFCPCFSLHVWKEKQKL